MTELFDPLYAAGPVAAATDAAAWLRAMLDVEAALARAEARAGLIPAGAADAITEACDTLAVDPAAIGERAVASATPVVPLVAALRDRLPSEFHDHVHAGATSQDIVDSAMGLVAARALDALDATLGTVSQSLARLAREHRDTPQIGRTLLQHAAPTTFGRVAAGWLVGVDEARALLRHVRRERLAVQCGGAVGTLAAYGNRGTDLVALLADELGLAAPTIPWHTTRGRIGELAAALGVTAGALATVAGDVALLAASDIGEVAEGSPGGSSAMPHKRNPARAVLVTACATQVPGLVATVLAAAPQELQRAAGHWQAEWPVVGTLLRLVGSAATHADAMLAGLRVDAARMGRNLDAADIPPGGGTGSAGHLVDLALAAHEEAA
jgi:3-carboxy-cis,cis-muconate cycloisomerase